MNKVFGRMFVEFGVMLGRMEHAKLNFYSSRAVKQQERNLKKLMSRNKNTEYGKKNNFKENRQNLMKPIQNWLKKKKELRKRLNGLVT